MAKLPSALDLGDREMQRSGAVRVPTLDYSPLEQVGRRLEEGLTAVARADAEVDDYETRRRLVDFKLRSEMELEAASRNMPVGAEGYSQAWEKRYKQLASEFVGKDDANIPRSQRQKIGLALQQNHALLQERAMRTEMAEKERRSVEKLEETAGAIKSKVETDPSYAGQAYEELAWLAANQPHLTPARREAARRTFAKEVFKTAGTAQVLGIRDEADMERLRTRLRLDMPDQVEGAPAGKASLPGGVGELVDQAAAKHGLDPNLLRAYVKVESGGNPRNVTGSYKGLFQLSEEEFRKYGGTGDIFDPVANAEAGAAKIKAESAEFEKRMGRPPSAAEIYMIHQQGAAGAAAHAASPDRPAWQSMLSTGEGRQKGEAWAKKAIWGNVPDDMKGRFGSVENLTSGDFVKMWEGKLARAGAGGKGEPVPPSLPAGPEHDLARHLSLNERKALWGQAEAQWKQIEKQRRELAAQDWLNDVLSGKAQFNGAATDQRKLMDDKIAESNLAGKIQSGDLNAARAAVQLSHQLRYTPKSAGEGITALVQSNKDGDRASGYSAILNILEGAPNALDHMPGHEQMIRDARDFQFYHNMYGSPQKALQRMKDDRDPEKKRARAIVDKEADEFVKTEVSADKLRESVARGTMADWWSRPELGGSPEQQAVILSEFQNAARREFERTGNKELSIKQAVSHLHRRFGVTDRGGAKYLMQYPPERFYPPVAGSYDYIDKDLKTVVGTYGPDAQAGTTRLTFAGMGSDQRPTYYVSWLDKNGLLKMAPSRWTPGDEKATADDWLNWTEKRKGAMERSRRPRRGTTMEALRKLEQQMPEAEQN